MVSIPAAAIVAGAGLIYKVGVDWVPKLTSESAIIVKHLSSEPPKGDGSDFIASFAIENISMHTIYVENIEVTRPTTGVEVRHLPASRPGWSSDRSSPTELPWLLLANQEVKFAIDIDKNRLPIDVEKKPFGLFKIETSILHRKSSNISKEIVFRIRGF